MLQSLELPTQNAAAQAMLAALQAAERAVLSGQMTHLCIVTIVGGGLSVQAVAAPLEVVGMLEMGKAAWLSRDARPSPPQPAALVPAAS